MCAHKDPKSGRYFTKKCSPVLNYTDTYYTSDDLTGDKYIGVCPYFPNCALSSSRTCQGVDSM